jgi:hypothetical protein
LNFFASKTTERIPSVREKSSQFFRTLQLVYSTKLHLLVNISHFVTFDRTTSAWIPVCGIPLPVLRRKAEVAHKPRSFDISGGSHAFQDSRKFQSCIPATTAAIARLHHRDALALAFSLSSTLPFP